MAFDKIDTSGIIVNLMNWLERCLAIRSHLSTRMESQCILDLMTVNYVEEYILDTQNTPKEKTDSPDGVIAWMWRMTTIALIWSVCFCFCLLSLCESIKILAATVENVGDRIMVCGPKLSIEKR
jgi:hypothetical protein